jgi:hypothetical protein
MLFRRIGEETLGGGYITPFEPQVPPDAQDDDFLVEMPALEEILC